MKITTMMRFILLGFGIIYFWFGFLKFYPGLSPAEVLAGTTIEKMTFGVIETPYGNIILAIIECTIGICLIFGIRMRWALYALIGHLTCTFIPVLLLSNQIFSSPPFGLTLTGQYIMKNLIFLGAALNALKEIKNQNDRMIPTSFLGQGARYLFASVLVVFVIVFSLYSYNAEKSTVASNKDSKIEHGLRQASVGLPNGDGH